MFGLGWLSDVWSFVIAAKAFFAVGLIGGISAAVGFVIAWMLGRNVTSLAAAFMVGIVIVGLAGGSAVFGCLQDAKAQAQINQLENEKRKLALELAAVRAIREKEIEQAKALEEDLAKQKEVLAKIDAAIKSHEGDADQCPIAAFEDELEAIRALE